MSNVYQQEPPTSGKVILKTNYGDIEIELWTTETPRTCRNFLQLCMEGYYDKTLFHRIIKGFMIQGGDPTGTGSGGQSIYGAPFADEFHSRLRFSHRGIVAMANSQKPNSNLSQFFITAGECPWLDKQHTIFGKVEGQTMYNLVKINELEVKGERPVCDPLPQILRVEVTVNPFDNIVPRNLTRQDRHIEEKPKPQVQVHAQPIKNKNLLSFDEDAEEGGGENVSRFKKNKMQSSHDVLANDPMLSSRMAVDQEKLEQQRQRKLQQDQAKEALLAKVATAEAKKAPTGNAAEDVASELQSQFKAKHHKPIKLERELNKLRSRSRSKSEEKNVIVKATKRVADKRRDKRRRFTTKHDKGESEKSESESDYEEAGQMTEAQQQALEKTREQYNNMKADLLSFKTNKIGTLLDETNINVQARISALDLQRQKFLNQMKNTKYRENETLSKLKDFKNKIKSKDVKEDDDNWMNNKLKFHIDSQRAFDVNKAQEYQSRDNYESFLTGGDQSKKYANAYANVKRPDLGEDVIHSMNIEELVSMNELIELATKKKEQQ